MIAPWPAARRAIAFLGNVREPGDLLERVDDDVTDAHGDGPFQLWQQLVAAVQGDHGGVDPGGQRDLEFAAGAHVHAEALLGHPAQHPPAAKRLGCIEHRRLFAERLGEVAAPTAEVLLVQGEHRRAVLPGQIAGSSALRSAGGAGGCSAGSTSAWRGPAGWATRLTDSPLWLARDHNRSGASTPSRSRPARSAVPAAAASHSRATIRCLSARTPGPIAGLASWQSKYALASRSRYLVKTSGRARRAAPATRSGSQDSSSSSHCSLGWASSCGPNSAASSSRRPRSAA